MEGPRKECTSILVDSRLKKANLGNVFEEEDWQEGGFWRIFQINKHISGQTCNT